MRRLSRIRLAAIGSALACALALVPMMPASAHTERESPPAKNYLVLGDSVPFGFNPLLLAAGVLTPSAYIGFPEVWDAAPRPNLNVVNASCPGETSTSLITGNAADDNGCQLYRQASGGVHVQYGGTQLAYAKSYLAAHPRTKSVTVMIGANDLLKLQGACLSAPGDIATCIGTGLPAVLGTLQANLTTIYGGLRQQGYRGDFVAVSYYSTDYRNPLTTQSIAAVNAVLAGVTTSFGGHVADGFGAFQTAALAYGGDTCAAGLLIRFSATTCDIHPSRVGADLLAATVRSAGRES